jgi:hypothetical protein
MIDVEKLLKQFKKWAKGLLKVNPDYVTDPERLLPYLRGPNWDNPDMEYAHYKMTVGMYGDELLAEFERLREMPHEDAVKEYMALLNDSGLGNGSK